MRRAWPALLTLLLLLMASLPSATGAAVTARWHTFTAANGLAGNIVQALWEDPAGRLWFGTENGASRYDGRVWAGFAEADGLADSNVWAISGDATSVWFATSRGLSRLRDGAWRSYGLGDGLPGEDVRAVLATADGTVWAGTFGRGIARLRPGAERWEAVPLPGQGEREGTFVQAIWQSPAGDLWFATNGLGVLRLRDGAFERLSFRLGNRNTVWSVGALPEQDDIYLGTFLGLVRVSPDNQVSVFDEVVQGVPLASAEILAVAGDARGDLWLGTRSQGVLHRGAAGWARITAPDDLGRNYVQTILADRAGRVWFGTRGGGVSLLDPRPLDTDELRPRISAETVPDGSTLTIGGATLPAAANDLRFRFTVPLGWVPPEAVSFRYRLQRAGDRESGWQEARALPDAPLRASSAPFIDLAAGHYTLGVVAEVAGNAGSVAELPFVIASTPPALATPDLRVEGQPVVAGLSLPQRLLAGTRQVELRFAASDDLGGPETLRYEYRLGPDGPWQPTLGGHVTLTLPGGVWQVEGRAIDAEGNASAPALLRVVVPPPLWPTVLLALLVVLIPSVTSGIAGALLYRRWARRQALLRAVRGYHIPYDVGPLITAPERYIGRASVIDTIVGKVAQNSFYIYGEKRIGKTSLLLQVRDRLARRGELEPGRPLLPVFRNIQDVPQADFWLYLLRSIAGAMDAGPSAGLACLGQPAGYDDLDAEDDLDRLVALPGAAHAPPLIVLLLDEIDTLEHYDPVVRQRFRAFCQHAQEHLRVIVAGVHPPVAEPGDTSPWYNIFERVALGPLTEAEARQLIRDYNQNPYGYTADAEAIILRAAAHKPFDLQWLCSEAVRAMLADRRGVVRAADAERAVSMVVAARDEEYAAAWRLLSPGEKSGLHAGRTPLAPSTSVRLISEGLVAPAPQGGYQATGLWRIWLAEQHER